METNNKLKKMLKGIIRSVKKSKKNPTERHFSNNDDENQSNTQSDHEENCQISARRGPLLTWSPSLDNLVKSCKAEKQIQNRYENVSFDEANDKCILDSTHFPDECKMTLKFDSPYFCSTGRKNVNTERLIYSEQTSDASYFLSETINFKNQVADITEGSIKIVDNISDIESSYSTFISNVDKSISNFTSDKLDFKNDDYAQFESCTAQRSASNATVQSSIILDDAYDSTPIASNNIKYMMSYSESLVVDHSSSHASDNIPKKHFHTSSNLFDVINSTPNRQYTWSVVPIEFDKPLVSIHCYDMLKEGDIFLEINGIVVFQMNKQAIMTLFDSFPQGCLIRAVVLRKVV